MGRSTKVRLDERVSTAAASALGRERFVAPVDVLAGMGWLSWRSIKVWRQGRADYLAAAAPVPLDRLLEALTSLRRWAGAHGLTPSEVEYVAAARDRRPLVFTADADPDVERLFRTHWMSAALPEQTRERMTQRQSAAPDIVVIQSLNEFTCAGCGATDQFLIMEDAGPICMTCADMDHLVFLPAGDAALTRRARKASGLSAVVVRFSRSRKQYERKGLLVEPEALDSAEEQCLADEELRARRRERDRVRRELEDLDFQARLANEIRRLFPNCPLSRAQSIADHTAVRGSGRVGRTAAGRALDENAITAAVVASVRHSNTEYDHLLMSGVRREDARDRVRPKIDRILDSWRHSS